MQEFQQLSKWQVGDSAALARADILDRAAALPSMANYIIGGYIATMLALCLGGIITFDRLVHLQRRSYPDEWERDGKPWHGTFGEGGGAAWKNCSILWLFVTSPWMREDKRAFRLLMMYRGLGFAFAASLFSAVLYRVL